VAWRNLALTSCVLLVQLVGWLASLPDSREPLMGLAARLALSYQLLWCAIAVSSPKQLPIAIGIVLVVTYPTGWASWIVLGYAYTIFNDFGPFGLVIGFVLGALANAVVITAPLMLIEILLADSTVAHRLALRSAMALALRHVMGWRCRAATHYRGNDLTHGRVLTWPRQPLAPHPADAAPDSCTLPARSWDGRTARAPDVAPPRDSGVAEPPYRGLIAWGATTAATELARPHAVRQSGPLQSLMEFAAKIDRTREWVLGVR
jgi:hypothetical protein